MWLYYGLIVFSLYWVRSVFLCVVLLNFLLFCLCCLCCVVCLCSVVCLCGLCICVGVGVGVVVVVIWWCVW